MQSWNPTPGALFGDDPGAGREETIELVGPHLRLTGTIALGRFGRLSDLVNSSRGYVRIHDARLLRRNGEPTRLTLPKILVNQDEISFIAQGESTDRVAPEGIDTPAAEKRFRSFVLFTPGHTLSGSIFLYGETDLLSFADSTDPRFVSVVGVRTQSLADRRIISHYAYVLVNRTQILALSEVGLPDTDEVVEGSTTGLGS
jgi:hypothetical protein